MAAAARIYPRPDHRLRRHAHRRRRESAPRWARLLPVVAMVVATVAIGGAIATAFGPARSVSPAAGVLGSPGPAARAAESSAPASQATDVPTRVVDIGPPLVRPSAACSIAGPVEPDRGPRPGAGLASAPARAAHPRPVAVVIGDSYSSGWRGVGEGSESWPSIVAGAFGWRLVNLAVPGTGFVNPGWTGQPHAAVVDAAVAARPGIVIVAGGHNDEFAATSRTTAAASAVLEELRARLPNARLVVIGPIWPDGDPVATILALRDHLRTVSGSIGALFIDPIAGGWFSGANGRYVSADGIHPTTAGYRHIASQVGAALRVDGRFQVTTIPAGEPITTPVPAPVPAPTPSAVALPIRPGSTVGCPG